jgi:hypothetical protein
MNWLDKNDQQGFTLCDDRTGETLNITQRYAALDTLKVIHEIHSALKSTPVATFEVHCAMRTLCQHFGWAPADIALVEHYAVATQVIADGSAVMG